MRQQHARGRLSAVIYKVGDVWYGQCLEHDIAVRAKAPWDIPGELERMIAVNKRIAEENGLSLGAIPPAPHFYHAMFENGMRLMRTRASVPSKPVAKPVASLRLSETLVPV